EKRFVPLRLDLLATTPLHLYFMRIAPGQSKKYTRIPELYARHNLTLRRVCKDLGAFLCRPRRPKNRAFRYKSSDLPMQILWAFRCNPLARAPAANIRP
ncbi:MAG: hypothetical protein LBK44_00700, partial [Spirochaetales bacterium]|nr:hypothetical protein [Spirochaetales bacterium]